MQQRQLRLGDILDDYCPRERRITNHAVVAMIGQDIKQTRCTTCEHEHDYRHGKVPPQRKKKEAPGALFKQVLDGQKTEGIIPAAPAGNVVPAVPQRREPPAPPPPPEPAPEPVLAAETSEEPRDEEGPVHRQLIRATLPRPEGQAPTRPAPDFTMRQPAGRPGRFRPGGPRGNQRSNRPINFSQPQGGSGQKTHGMRHGPPNRHGDRPGPMSNRPGNRAPHQHRSSGHPMNPQGRSGKKRHR
jgi:hypothetical protein